MKNKYIYIFFISYFLSDECLNNWFENNSILDKNNFYLTANVNNDSIKFFNDLNAKRFRIDTNKFILISDKISISKYIPNDNQLYIDKKDEKFDKYIHSFFNFNKLKRKVKKSKNNIYKLDNKLSNTYLTIYFDIECQNIDSIFVKNNDYTLLVKEIKIDSISSFNNDSLFNLNLDLDKIEVYDFR